MTELSTITELQNRICLHEDKAAYRVLYDLLFPSLFRFSYSLVKSKEAAEEIVSDVFIKIWLIRTDLKEIGNLRSYMFKITKNLSLNFIAENSRVSILKLDDVSVNCYVSMNNPETYFISSELDQKLKSVIASLPTRSKIVFQLIKEDGLEYKEVAKILDISVHTVRNLLASAVRKIYEAIPAYVVKTTYSKK